MIRHIALAATAALMLVAAPALAQNDADIAAYPVQQENDDEFPWGLLGLLGLAGLAGLKRRDDRVHVDTRRP
jgi:MYXO-CTERM domain-containing protein